MQQILHRSATTTEAIRRAIQNSQAILRELAVRYGINLKTVGSLHGCLQRHGINRPPETHGDKPAKVLSDRLL